MTIINGDQKSNDYARRVWHYVKMTPTPASTYVRRAKTRSCKLYQRLF